MPTPRELARERTMTEIVRLGRQQLVEAGPAGLSVRSIARDLGVVSSAIYRYVRTRDELLTLLVADAYNELADRMEAAARNRRGGSVAKLRAACRAIRTWAVEEPARYGLIYGTPVPGYHAPAEQTTPAGTRVVLLLAGLVDEGWKAGELASPAGPRMPAALRRDLDGIRSQVGLDVPDELLTRALLLWTSVFGAISFEVFGQYGPDSLTEPRQLFEHQLDVLLASMTAPS